MVYNKRFARVGRVLIQNCYRSVLQFSAVRMFSCIISARTIVVLSSAQETGDDQMIRWLDGWKDGYKPLILQVKLKVSTNE